MVFGFRQLLPTFIKLSKPYDLVIYAVYVSYPPHPPFWFFLLNSDPLYRLDHSAAQCILIVKGQLISKGLFGGIVSTKNPTKIF